MCVLSSGSSWRCQSCLRKQGYVCFHFTQHVSYGQSTTASGGTSKSKYSVRSITPAFRTHLNMQQMRWWKSRDCVVQNENILVKIAQNCTYLQYQSTCPHRKTPVFVLDQWRFHWILILLLFCRKLKLEWQQTKTWSLQTSWSITWESPRLQRSVCCCSLFFLSTDSELCHVKSLLYHRCQYLRRQFPHMLVYVLCHLLQDLLYRRSRALVDYENANKALDKARAKNRDVLQAETTQQLCCHKFEKISESAKQGQIQIFTDAVVVTVTAQQVPLCLFGMRFLQ